MLILDDLDLIIAEFIRNESLMSFEEIAQLVHAFQFQNNTFYRQHCIEKKIGVIVDSIDCIPSFEVEYFKGKFVPSVDDLSLRKGMCFETSGTLNGEKTKIYRDEGYFKLRSLTIQKQGEDNWFKRYRDRVKIICLDKANRRNQNDFKEQYSVLNNIVGYFGNDESRFYNHNDNFYKIIDEVIDAAAKQAPLVLIGPSYYFSDIIIRIKDEGIIIPINNQLLIMDSGGLKNKCLHQFYKHYKEDLFKTFGLQTVNYKNTYAMTEMGSQISDDEQGKKVVPRWAKIKLLDENGDENNTTGKIVIWDLLNRANIFCIKTNDRACYKDDGLIIYGKEL